MELAEHQKETVREWARKGYTLSDIQRALSEEFGLAATYMEVRFLAIDLGLEIRDRKKQEPDVDVEPENADANRADFEPDAGYGSAVSGVRVTADPVTKPGAVISGSVVFSDGTNGSWMLDQMGRVALEGNQPGYKPSAADIQSFREELRKALEAKGF